MPHSNNSVPYFVLSLVSIHLIRRGQECAVGIATRYGLDGPGIESQWGPRSSAPIQTGPGTHPTSFTLGTGCFPRVKRPGRGADPAPHLHWQDLKLGRTIPLPVLRALVACYREKLYLNIQFGFEIKRFLFLQIIIFGLVCLMQKKKKVLSRNATERDCKL